MGYLIRLLTFIVMGVIGYDFEHILRSQSALIGWDA